MNWKMDKFMKKKKSKETYIPFPEHIVIYKSLGQSVLDEIHGLRVGTCEVCGRCEKEIQISFLDGFYSRKMACIDCRDFFKKENK